MEQWKSSELSSWEQWAGVLLEILRPLKRFYSPGKAYLTGGESGVSYGSRTAGMEGFARILWGLGPLWSQTVSSLPEELQKESKEWQVICREGFIHGTDPSHKEYWGALEDYDQKMVEMAALATALSLAPEVLWEPLSGKERGRVVEWLGQINGKQINNNNWRYFRILVNMAFQVLGIPWSEKYVEEDFRVLESCYMSGGWYYDGNPGQIDYYIPFAIHFYGLIYSRFMEEKDPQRSERLKKRAEEFFDDYCYWFGENGKEVPFGRSLTYRFAHGAFFSAAAFAGVRKDSMGIQKYLAAANLRSWLERPIFDRSGFLSIGYGYPNLFMSEIYNAHGSPYWGLKIFLVLALPKEHAFWMSSPQRPVYETLKLLPQPHMVITHDQENHVQMFPTGQHTRKEFGCCREKYEKFVYSNQFGFSVSRGHTLESGAFDNTLAVSPKGLNCYTMRDKTVSYQALPERLVEEYEILPGVKVRTTIIPGASWHFRIHEIANEIAVDVADGGYAIEIQGDSGEKVTPKLDEGAKDRVIARFPWGMTGAVSLTGGKGSWVQTFPNTNLLFPLAAVPMLTQTLGAGNHVLINGFVASRTGGESRFLEELENIKKTYGQ